MILDTVEDFSLNSTFHLKDTKYLDLSAKLLNINEKALILHTHTMKKQPNKHYTGQDW